MSIATHKAGRATQVYTAIGYFTYGVLVIAIIWDIQLNSDCGEVLKDIYHQNQQVATISIVQFKKL